MARQLAKMGVPLSRCVLESLSDDTIGNLLFARLLHTDARPSWRDVLVITSAFQAPRAAAIADWVECGADQGQCQEPPAGGLPSHEFWVLCCG